MFYLHSDYYRNKLYKLTRNIRS